MILLLTLAKIILIIQKSIAKQSAEKIRWNFFLISLNARLLQKKAGIKEQKNRHK